MNQINKVNFKYKSQAIFFAILALIFIFPIMNAFSFIIDPEEEYYVPYDYEITAYHVDMSLSENNVLSVQENLTVQHNEQMHGIVRAIPYMQTIVYLDGNGDLRSNNYKTKIYDVSVTGAHETYDESGIFYIKLGSASQYVTGTKNYEYSYKIDLGDDRITEFDQFYYNIIGNYWDTTITGVSFKITLPKAVTDDLIIYHGLYGAINEDTVSPTQNGLVFEYSHGNTVFQAGEGVTALIKLEEGYFSNLRDFTSDIVVLGLLLAIVFVAIMAYNKNTNRKPMTPVVSFEPPKDMPPSEVGYVIDGTVDNQDIASLIIYWAQKGYLKIVNTAEEGKKEKFELIKLSDADDKMKKYEKDIFNKIFGKEIQVKLKDIGEKIYMQVLNAKNTILTTHEKEQFNTKALMARGLLTLLSALSLGFATIKINSYNASYGRLILALLVAGLWFGLSSAMLFKKDNQYKTNALKSNGFNIMLFLGFSVLYGAFALFTYHIYSDPFFLTFLSIIPSMIALYLARNINIRTDKGILVLGEVVGFRQFIELTEKDRIEMLVKENPEMFYELLPYAYVLGVSDKWINKFKDIAIDPPKWYGSTNSNVTFFDYLIFRSLFHSVMLNSMTTMSYRPQVNSIKTNGVGGGFGGFGGGGGFTGGGFGGGGGRGW